MYRIGKMRKKRTLEMSIVYMIISNSQTPEGVNPCHLQGGLCIQQLVQAIV